MGDKTLSALASSIVSRKCALFVGAGVTAASGGVTWKQLVDSLIDEYNYKSPLKDNFDIVSDICRKNGTEEVYQKIKSKLKNVKISGSLLKLMELPWFSAFTTNYDTALEDALEAKQKLTVKTLVTGNEFELDNYPSELLCIKLMGSVSYPYNQPGSMIITREELAKAKEERSRIFGYLERHAHNLSFIFMGYSFDDEVFLDILNKLRAYLGPKDNKYYALFREEDRIGKDKEWEEKKYLLEQMGVTIIIDDIKSFSDKFLEEVSLRDVNDLTKKRISLGKDIIPIDTTKLSRFLYNHPPVLFEEMEQDISLHQFLKGNKSSYKPFNLGWHFYRNQIGETISHALKCNNGLKEPYIFNINGNPGSGRTFILLSSLCDLILNHRSIGIKIDINSNMKIPKIDELEFFINEIENTIKERGWQQPERIIFWSENPLDEDTLINFDRLNQNWTYRKTHPYPLILLYEDTPKTTYGQEIFLPKVTININANKKLSSEKKIELSKYLKNVIKECKLPEIDEEESNKVIEEEKTLLPILYRILDPSRRSIQEIIQQEYNGIKEPEVKACIAFCALASSFQLDFPVALLKKSLGDYLKKYFSYPDIFNITVDKGNTFILHHEDPKTNPLVSIYHPVIAQHIVKITDEKQFDDFLISIASIIDLRQSLDSTFIFYLLIINGVNRICDDFTPFSYEGLEKALLIIKKKQPVRGIMHHLARMYFKKDKQDARIIPLLKEALTSQKEEYLFRERKENVYNTLGKILWEQKKEKLIGKSRTDPEITEIFEYLILARKGEFHNIYPYDVHARILREIWQNKKEEERLPLINEAIEVLNEGLDNCDEINIISSSLSPLLIHILQEVDIEKAKDAAKELFEKKGDGSGYYTLALNEYYNESNPTGAISYLDIAIKAKSFPLKAIVLKMEIMLKDKNPNYDELFKLANTLSSSSYVDNWKSAYFKAVIYTIMNETHKAARCFRYSYRFAPSSLEKKIQIFWMDSGHRKVLTGRIGTTFTNREGRIFPHNVDGYKGEIFFNPNQQKFKLFLSQGVSINFELGFSPRGPIAFEVRPTNLKTKSK